MKYLTKITGLILITSCMLQACKKDPGNYTYTELNEAKVGNLDSLYSVKPGQILHISPKVAYTKDQVGDTLNYEYSWREIGPANDPYFTEKPKIVSEFSILNLKISGGLGLYNYSFRVTDKRTGVWNEFYFKVLKANRFYEGWLLLSETSGVQSRLDMLSYQAVAGKYEFIPDVLGVAHSSLKLKGKPSFISYDSDNGPIVGTSELATFMGMDSLQYEPRMDFSNHSETHRNVIIGNAKMESSTFKPTIWANGNVYTENSVGQYYSLNTMLGENAPFKAAPFLSYSPDFVGGYRPGIILFNEATSEFVWNPKNDATRTCMKIENENLFQNKTGKNLLFMRQTPYNGYDTFALLKDKTGDKVYLARFDVAKQYYYAEIANNTIAKGQCFEVSNDFGYVFYSIGGKLYEYDFNQNLTREMADYGSRKITLLKFQNIGKPIYSQRYADIAKRLCVCTYDENNPDSSGSMDLYSVPPIGGQLVKQESFSGMGKIVSITYMYR